MKKNFLIVHYNTPKLTECLVKSINKFVGADCHIYIFDNSDKSKFTYKQSNLTVFDNTRGAIINFDAELKKYPNHIYSLGAKSKWGSFKHCISVDKCFDLINDNFVLLDSDVLLRRNVDDIFDNNYYSCGEIIDWSWGADKKRYPVHKRIRPFITFINVNRCKEENIRYYNDQFMDGLYDSTHFNNKEQMNKDSYDTGCWFYEQVQYKPIKQFNHEDYVVHFRGGSYSMVGGNEKLTAEQWLAKYKYLYTANNKKVVYTCITGGYDRLLEPTKITDDYDYVCYTDNPSLTSKTWQIRQLPKECEILDNVRRNRYIKMHTHTLFSEYDLSIYVDGSIRICGDLNEFTKTCELNKYNIVIPKHPARDCIYKEAPVCVSMRKDTAEHINPQIQRYREEGFPERYGLTQNNIIVRKHNTKECIDLMEKWWKEVVNGSYRDQLSLMYVLWKSPGTHIKQLPSNTCHSKYFSWMTHPKRPIKPVEIKREPSSETVALDMVRNNITELKKQIRIVRPVVSENTQSIAVNKHASENRTSINRKSIGYHSIIHQRKAVNKQNISDFFK